MKKSKIKDFTRMNPPTFSRSKSIEDPRNFLDCVEKVKDIMGFTLSESGKFSIYQLKGVGYTGVK